MMISMISFTEKGMELSFRLAEVIRTAVRKEAELKKEMTGKAGLQNVVSEETECRLFTKCSAHPLKDGIEFVGGPLGDWAGEQMDKKNALVFIGACGIAVRAVAPYITNKLHDSPVLVADERGNYVIPLLSGHVGGANELAVFLAEGIGAVPVITTATDLNGKFAVDLFAKRNGLAIADKGGIAKVSAKVLAGQSVTLSVEEGHIKEDVRLPEGIGLVPYPPAGYVDIVITSEKREFDRAVLLFPKEYVIGMGCRRGKEGEQIEKFVKKTLEELDILNVQVAALASIDLKKDEAGFLDFCRTNGISFLTYSAEELRGVKGTFHSSGFVREKTGVDNVCERAALKACGCGGKLIYEKHGADGMTIAVAKRDWSVRFDEA